MPPTTLKGHLSGRVIHGTKPGPVPYLTKEEEEKYLVDAARCGYGKKQKQVKGIVEWVERGMLKGMLHSECISDGWWKRYLFHYPKVSLRAGDATAHVSMYAVMKENMKE